MLDKFEKEKKRKNVGKFLSFICGENDKQEVIVYIIRMR